MAQDNENKLKQVLEDLFAQQYKTLPNTKSGKILEIREKAFNAFKSIGFPHTKMEDWRHTPIAPILNFNYTTSLSEQKTDFDIEKMFQCEITEMDAIVVSQVNGWVTVKGNKLVKLEQGIIVGSIAQAMIDCPEIIEKHFAKYAKFENDGLIAINTALAADGIFIYIPNDVKVTKPIQIINIISSLDTILVQPRNLVIVGKNSNLTLVHCDHSLTHNVSFINSVTEIFVDDGGSIDHYKMQNKGNTSALITSTFFNQEQNSKVNTNTLTLNGGFIRNNIDVLHKGHFCETNLYGLYLVDGNQLADNHINVNHAFPDCQSNQFYKGILDENSKAVFNGKVIVHKDAQRTKAYQSNKNILLTDNATINTKPHLEIYADDVKCSHGATVGQLDAEALFYLRSRGIGIENAKMLLMSAFAAEIIQKIEIPSLKDRIDYLVDKRLKGELSICDQCILNCKSNAPVVFNIDMEKV